MYLPPNILIKKEKKIKVINNIHFKQKTYLNLFCYFHFYEYLKKVIEAFFEIFNFILNEKKFNF